MLNDDEFYSLMGGSNSNIYKGELETLVVGKTIYERKKEVLNHVVFPALNKILSPGAVLAPTLFPGFGDVAVAGFGAVAMASVINDTNKYLGIDVHLSSAEYTAALKFITGVIGNVVAVSKGINWTASTIAGVSGVGLLLAIAILNLPTTNIATAYTIYEVSNKYTEDILHNIDSFKSELTKQIVLQSIKALQSMGIVPDCGELVGFLRDFVDWKSNN